MSFLKCLQAGSARSYFASPFHLPCSVAQARAADGMNLAAALVTLVAACSPVYAEFGQNVTANGLRADKVVTCGEVSLSVHDAVFPGPVPPDSNPNGKTFAFWDVWDNSAGKYDVEVVRRLMCAPVTDNSRRAPCAPGTYCCMDSDDCVQFDGESYCLPYDAAGSAPSCITNTITRFNRVQTGAFMPACLCTTAGAAQPCDLVAALSSMHC